MSFYCDNTPFSNLGFVQHDENLWVKFTEGKIAVPHFALTTTINPTQMTFVIKDLIQQKTVTLNSFDSIKEFIVTSERDAKLKKILD